MRACGLRPRSNLLQRPGRAGGIDWPIDRLGNPGVASALTLARNRARMTGDLMARQFIALVTASLCLALSAPLAAQKDGRSRGHAAVGAKRNPSSRPGAARTPPGHRTHSNRAAHSQAAKRALEGPTGSPNEPPRSLVHPTQPP